MAPKFTVILDFAVSQTWKCLSVPATGKNSIFSQVFFDEEILSEIASDANLTFAPGLLEVVQSPTPPTIEFFKKLPVKYLGLWGIYVLVLEKLGCPTLIYIGEATETKKGIRQRWYAYDKPETYRKLLPSKVAEALDDGYKIVHKGVLAYTGIPSAKDVPRFRVLFYALEAMFSFLFWAMYPKGHDYQIGSCCPWPQGSFTYGGLCSHSSLNDPMKANVDLSPEQLEMLAAQNDENKRIRARRLARRAAKIYYCEHCQQAVDTPAELERHNESNNHKSRVAKLAAGVEFKFRCEPCGKSFETAYDLEGHEEKSERHKEKVASLPAGSVQPSAPRPPVKRRHRRTKAERASQKLYCDICELPFKKPYELPRHNDSVRHKKRVEELAAGIKHAFRCAPCGYSGTSAKLLDDHRRTARHKAKVAARKSSA